MNKIANVVASPTAYLFKLPFPGLQRFCISRTLSFQKAINHIAVNMKVMFAAKIKVYLSEKVNNAK